MININEFSISKFNRNSSINTTFVDENDLLTRYLNDVIDIYTYNNYDKFIQKYQINYSTYFTSKLHFLNSDQQMFIIHSFYRKFLSQKIVSWNYVNILFQNELEYKLNRPLKDKEIYHTAITESFIVPIDTFKIKKDSSLLSLALKSKVQRPFKDELQHKLHRNFIFSNLIDATFLTEKISHIDTNKIFKLEQDKYSLYVFIHNNHIIIAIGDVLQTKPLELKQFMIDKPFNKLTSNQFINYCNVVILKLDNQSIINTKQRKAFFNIIYNYL